MVKIVQKDDPILRKTAKEVSVKEIGAEKTQKIIADMKEALGSQDDGVAIAAPQIGVSLRIFVVSGKILPDEEGTPGNDRVFINPVIQKVSKKKEEMDEGCLSVRWKYGMVKRPTNTSVKAYDENGNTFLYNATGLLSQVFQHEIDHLEGVLFTDKARDLRDINPEDIKQEQNNEE